MELAQLHSRALMGLNAPRVTVEVHLANGLPCFTLVGLADIEVREARERVRAAINNSGLTFPTNRRITVNLAPADLPKDSGRFDLPIALGILAASGQIDVNKLNGFEFAGELSLSGALRPIRAALPMVLALQKSLEAQEKSDPSKWVLPFESAHEAALAPGCTVYGARHLLDVVRQFVPSNDQSGHSFPTNDTTLNDGWHLFSTEQSLPTQIQPLYPDMAQVKGQLQARRALEIAAAGGHHILMVGPPGAGKSMLAQRFAGLLPSMSFDESLQSAAMASLVGEFNLQHWLRRPVRSPHHTASAVALVGGGVPPRPGEISRAHAGVLFLDELPEFPRSALEALREPLETGHIHISRAASQADFPARFQLIAAMNPCPCGQWGTLNKSCRCTPDQVRRYQNRLSGPILDRIDLHIELPAIAAHELLDKQEGEESAAIRQRVIAAREIALQRQGFNNRQLNEKSIKHYALLKPDATSFLQQAAQKMHWSARIFHSTIKVARSIADLANSEAITREHIAEAAQYRRALLSNF